MTPKQHPTKQRSDIQREAFGWRLVNEQPVLQAASLYSLRNSAKHETTHSYSVPTVG